MANLKTWEKKKAVSSPVCSTHMRERRTGNPGTPCSVKDRSGTPPQEMEAGEAEQMNGVYPFPEVYARVLAHGKGFSLPLQSPLEAA